MPLGFGGKKPAVSRAQLLRLMRRIDLPDNDGRIHFMQTVTAITHAQIGVPLPLCDLTRKMVRATSAHPAAVRAPSAALPPRAPCWPPSPPSLC